MRQVLIAIMILMVLLAAPVFAGGNREEEGQASGEATEQGSGTAQDQSADEADSAEAVAEVNGEAVLRGEFESAFDRSRRRMMQQNPTASEAQMNELRGQVLENLIERELLYQESITEGFGISQQRVDLELESIRANFATQEEYQRALDNLGVSQEELELDIAKSLAIQSLLEEQVLASIEVSEDEARSFYDENAQMFTQPDQVRARHILIATQGLEDQEAVAEARSRAEDLLTEIEEGADFAALAQEHSEGPSASRGGDLGLFGRGQMVPAFEEAAFALEEGEVSGIVETQFGFHIIQVTEKVAGGPVPFQDVRGDIDQFLLQQKQGEAIRSYVDGLLEEAEIVRHVEFG